MDDCGLLVLEWCDQGFKALADLPATQTISFGDSSYAIKSTNGSTVTAIEQVLESKIAVSNTGEAAYAGNAPSAQGSPQFSLNPLDLGKNVEAVWKYVISRGVNLVWQILFAIYLLCLLLCKVIIVLMQFLQKVTVIGFKLYAPIGVAEYAHHSLKSKSTAFFLTFVGIMAWPVGWSIVNAVTLGVLKSIPAPQDQNFATLIIAIVLAIPVLLWIVIGHVLAPIYVQKIVMRGGGVVQGFAGTIFSTVGAGSMAAYSSVSSGWANGLRNGQQRSEDGHNSKELRESSRRNGFELLPLASDIFSSDDCFETDRKRLAGASVASGGRQAGAGRFSKLGAGALDAGTQLMSRMGSAARFIGHAAAEGCGDGAGLDYRALAAFAPQSANYRNLPNRANRSSLQARKYLSDE